MGKDTTCLREGTQFHAAISVLSRIDTVAAFKKPVQSVQHGPIHPKRMCKTCLSKRCIGRCRF